MFLLAQYGGGPGGMNTVHMAAAFAAQQAVSGGMFGQGMSSEAAASAAAAAAAAAATMNGGDRFGTN